MLHQSNIRVEFSQNVLRQVDEAKRKYIEARNESRIITDLENRRIDSFRQAIGGFIIQEHMLSDQEFAFRIFDETGDRRVIWNSNDPDQIKEAKNEFDKYVAKGWKPYAINVNGSMGKRIRAFDASSEEIIFDEKDGGTREKLKNFASKFKEIKLMPRTYPG